MNHQEPCGHLLTIQVKESLCFAGVIFEMHLVDLKVLERKGAHTQR